MGLFDRFENETEVPASGYDSMSAMGDDPDSWNALANDDLKQLVIMKCLEYGMTQDGSIAQAPLVLDVQRVLPTYEDSENPMRIIRQTSIGDYLEEIRPRLEALEADETEPKVIPKIFDVWEAPEPFRGRIG